MAEETRYWKRMGMRVTKGFALEAATKMEVAASYHDDDTLEFVQVSFDSASAVREVEALFEKPDDDGDTVDAENRVLLDAMELHKERGKKIRKFRKAVRKEFLSSEELIPIETFVAEKVELGWEEHQATIQYETELEAKIIAEADVRYQEWYDIQVVALQKHYGTYKEPLDEEE